MDLKRRNNPLRGAVGMQVRVRATQRVRRCRADGARGSVVMGHAAMQPAELGAQVFRPRAGPYFTGQNVTVAEYVHMRQYDAFRLAPDVPELDDRDLLQQAAQRFGGAKFQLAVYEFCIGHSCLRLLQLLKLWPALSDSEQLLTFRRIQELPSQGVLTRKGAYLGPAEVVGNSTC